MKPAYTSAVLLYVSNADGTVSVFDYQSRGLVGVLTKFSKPRGECTDSAGNIYITDYGTSKVDKYARGGTKPIEVLNDAPYTPDACAVAPSSANLAIANYPSGRYSKGAIAIYSHGSGKPAIYQTGNDDHFVSCAYDRHGDLLVASEVGAFEYYTYFYYLPKGGTQLITEDLSAPSQRSGWRYVQGVVWDGKYWAILSYNKLYRFTINVIPKYVDTIALSGGYGTAVAPSVYRKGSKSPATQIVAGSSSYSGRSAVEYWAYPTGGSPAATITKYIDSPTGTAISLATGRK